MSVEETNRVRAMLGLKPLNVGGSAPGKPTDDEVRVILFYAVNSSNTHSSVVRYPCLGVCVASRVVGGTIWRMIFVFNPGDGLMLS